MLRRGGRCQQVIDRITVRGVGRGDCHLVDELGVGVDRQVGLVAVEATVLGLVTMASLGIHDGDDPVPGHAGDDAEHAVVAFGNVLAGHHRQQVGRLPSRARQAVTVEHPQCAQRVMHQVVHQLLARRRVVPVTRRLAGGRVVIVACEDTTHPCRQFRRHLVEHHQHLADRRPKLGHRVLGSHRVIQRRGVQHPGPVLQHTSLASHHLDVLMQTPRPLGGPQPVALAHQRRGMERLGPGVHPRCGLPRQVTLEPVAGLLI